jgi:hypothetical protein
MESFGAALDRLTRQFISDVVDAVRTEISAAAPKRRTVVRRLVHRSAPAVEATPAVTISPFEIRVGRPRVYRSRGPRRPREIKPPPPPIERAATFQVVPHPDRKNRRLVLTRLG